MDRSREARRGTMAATAIGLSRRRQRNSSVLRDSPEEDGAGELQEPSRLRDRERGSKRDRDRERERDRERDRERVSRNKRRRGERMMHGREDGGEESSEDSADEDEDEDEEDAVSAAASLAVRLPSSINSISPPSSLGPPNHNHHHHHQNHHYQGKNSNFPAPTKGVRPAEQVWKAADEMIGVPVPRKARSASAKRSHECWVSGGGGAGGGRGGPGEQITRQASTSPARLTAPVGTSALASPASPSSSNASIRKKMKPIGSKQKPPKISKMAPSVQDDIEMEVAEVLFGMTRQFQSPSKQESASNASKIDSKDTNGTNNDAKSRVSSPTSISLPSAPQPSALLLQNSSSSAPPAIAPKRKKPRPMKLEEESSMIAAASPTATVPSVAKMENEAKVEISSPKLEKNPSSVKENGGGSLDIGSSQISLEVSHLQQDVALVIADGNLSADLKIPSAELDGSGAAETREQMSESVKDLVLELPSTTPDMNLEDVAAAKMDSTPEGTECSSEKFEIDLMALPPGKSSPDGDGCPNLAPEQKPEAAEIDTVPKDLVKMAATEAQCISKKQDQVDIGLEMKKTDSVPDELELQEQMAKEEVFEPPRDVEKQENDCSKQQIPKQQYKARRQEPKAEKTVQSASLPLPATITGWPGGLPPFGYMGQVPSIQSVVSMDRSAGSSTVIQPPHLFPPQPRPKRCATHNYIAKNIHYYQQIARLNPYWPGVAGSASIYGAKPCNLNAVPPVESAMVGNSLQGNLANRNLSSSQDRGASNAFSGLNDKGSAAPFMDTAQKKQLLQQIPQPPANNILAPAFIFPLNQHQPASATRSGAAKSTTPISNASPSTGASNLVSGVTPSSGSATTMSFGYAGLPTNEAQYLAIIQNGGYPFPIPAHFGATSPYRGSHPQALPFYNGSFYSSQMLPPSQLPHQQQPQPQASTPIQQGHQNPSTSSGSSSSQKQQQRLQGCSSNGRGATFPPSKQHQQQPQQKPQNQHLLPHQARQLEGEVASEDSPSTADSRVSHGHKNMYGHNFTMPFHHQNFALMSPVALNSASQGNEKQQQSLKCGTEFAQTQAFAMSFPSFSGTAGAPGLDFSSIRAKNQAVLQSIAEAGRHGYHISGAASTTQSAQQNNQSGDEGKMVESINQNTAGEEDRKMTLGKASATIPHSLTFSRSDADPSISTVLSNSVIDSSARMLNLIPPPANANRTSRPGGVAPTSCSSATPTVNTPNSQYQHQQQQQQVLQLQQQQLQHQLATRGKPATGTANFYSADCSPSNMAKFPNAFSVFPQALIQNNSPTQSQSPQWKPSVRPAAGPSPSSTAPMSSVKSIPQQQNRAQTVLPATGHTQISFGVNLKPMHSGQQLPSNNPSPSSTAVVLGSPPTSISKNPTGGSPMTLSTGSKTGPAPSALASSHQGKNSPSNSSRKASPVSSQNVPSILGNSPANSSQSPSVRPQQQQQKQPFQQSQFFFSNPYMQAQSPQSSTGTAAGGSYQRRQSEQQQHLPHQNSSTTSSAGMLPLCSQPLASLSVMATSDPTKAVAAATAAAAAANNLMKRQGLLPPGLLQAAQFTTQSPGGPHPFISAPFPYMNAMPAVSVKPAEQKPAAGNDN